MQIHKSTVYEGCSISLQPKVEAGVLYNCNLVRVQIYSIDEYTESLKLKSCLVLLLQIIKHSYPSRPSKWKTKWQNQASCGHPLPWSQGQNTQASLPGHGGHTWRGCPFVQHGKEMGWQIQTWQGEPWRQPPSMKTAQCPILSAFPFSRSR